MTTAMQMARDEREEFATLLDGLTPEQWDGARQRRGAVDGDGRTSGRLT